MVQEALGGNWIPLLEFALRRGVSLSTLRRHIKANKVKYRLESGRYLIFDEGGAPAEASADGREAATDALFDGSLSPMEAGGTSGQAERIHDLESQLKKARVEISELKTLIAFYEEQLQQLIT